MSKSKSKTAVTSVHIIGVNGDRLMPTFKFGLVRHLLKDGKAKIICRDPFTIQLLYETTSYVQPIEKCQDTGYLHIGSSLKSETAEYESRQLDLLPDEKQHHDDQRRYRRTRRNRKRYRKQRFDNRRASKKPGWIAPSLRHKYEQHIRDIEEDIQTAPVTDIYIEVGKFDPAMLKAVLNGDPIPEGTDYQRGPLYYAETRRQACFARDRYKWVLCGKGTREGAILKEHHAVFWQGRHGDTLDELVTVCSECHTAANHQPGGKLWGYTPEKAQNLQDATYMNTVRKKLFRHFKDRYPDIRVHFTYGTYTDVSRKELGVEKSHANDAYAMGQFHPEERAQTVLLQKRRRNNRILEKFYDAKYTDIRDGKAKTGKELGCERTNRSEPRNGKKNPRVFRVCKTKKGRRTIRKNHYGLQPGTVVVYQNRFYTAKGCHCNGKRVMLKDEMSGDKSVSINRVSVRNYASGWV